ncbi:ATP-dependent DNA helicase PIF1-like protein [Tanacetum coccineum]
MHWQDCLLNPASCERYYLRMLLNVVRGTQGFEELMTEWTRAISEASLWALVPQLRDIFVTMLLFCDVSRPLKLWEENWQDLSEDILDTKRKNFKSLSDFQDLPRPDPRNFFIASTGREADHSRFVIPLELMENNTCGIKQNTQLAELMQEVQLIIWDEAPMTQKYAFQALDITQILPVIPKAKRPEVLEACINRSELWKYCNVFTLTRSMRVNEYLANEDIDTAKQDFNRWVLAVGNGKLPAKMKEGEDEPTWIEILEKFLIKSWNSPIEQIVAETYPDFTTRQTDDEYLKENSNSQK